MSNWVLCTDHFKYLWTEILIHYVLHKCDASKPYVMLHTVMCFHILKKKEIKTIFLGNIQDEWNKNLKEAVYDKKYSFTGSVCTLFIQASIHGAGWYCNPCTHQVNKLEQNVQQYLNTRNHITRSIKIMFDNIGLTSLEWFTISQHYWHLLAVAMFLKFKYTWQQEGQK